MKKNIYEDKNEYEYQSILTLNEKLFFETEFKIDDLIHEVLFQLKKSEL